MSAETLQKPVEQSLEDQKQQLEAQKAEMLAYGMSPNDTRVKEIDNAINALETPEANLENNESPKNFPEVVTTGMFLKTNTIESTGKLEKLQEEINQSPEIIRQLSQELIDAGEILKKDSNNIDLKLALLKKQRQLEKVQQDVASKKDLVKKIEEGIQLQREKEANLQEAA
jgi:hypothetical protein